ncbi:CBP1 [Scenedesmus sp. PABB004]|nr:CBP1 [Scenedesmus sp. PABB004]
MRTAWVLALAPALLHAAAALAPGAQQQRPLAPAAGAPPADDEVLSLPGHAGALPSRHYAGYVGVGPAQRRQLFYYLVSAEAPRGSDADGRVIVWLTGGPGCSSMDAFAYEHGPFKMSLAPGAGAGGRALGVDDVVLSRNPHAWSRAAHVVYVDSPAGTGLSWSADRADYATGDGRTLDDLAEFVDRFFAAHPDLAERRELYIAGESYGGVYVPLLAARLLRDGGARAGAGGAHRPALAGVIVGNGVTDDAFDARGQLSYAWAAGLVDEPGLASARRRCEDGGWNPVEGDCGAAIDDLQASLEAAGINPYDTLSPCARGGDALAAAGARAPLLRQRLRATARRGGAAAGLGHSIACADRRASLAYFNAPRVRDAIHADSVDQAGRWEPCSDVLDYTHDAGSMLPVYVELLAGRVRALVYSGDADFIVPFTSTRAWVRHGLTPPLREARPWHAWGLPGSEQTAGWAVEFEEGLTMATVRGAGHMVPQSRPAESLELLRLWLAREL